jgi:hypothetical protein
MLNNFDNDKTFESTFKTHSIPLLAQIRIRVPSKINTTIKDLVIQKAIPIADTVSFASTFKISTSVPPEYTLKEEAELEVELTANYAVVLSKREAKLLKNNQSIMLEVDKLVFSDLTYVSNGKAVRKGTRQFMILNAYLYDKILKSLSIYGEIKPDLTER